MTENQTFKFYKFLRHQIKVTNQINKLFVFDLFGYFKQFLDKTAKDTYRFFNNEAEHFELLQ